MLHTRRSDGAPNADGALKDTVRGGKVATLSSSDVLKSSALAQLFGWAQSALSPVQQEKDGYSYSDTYIHTYILYIYISIYMHSYILSISAHTRITFTHTQIRTHTHKQARAPQNSTFGPQDSTHFTKPKFVSLSVLAYACLCARAL